MVANDQDITVVSGDLVTVNGREAKVFTLLANDLLKVRFKGERHSDIISVNDIDPDEPAMEQMRPVFDSDADMEDYYRVW